MTDLRYLHSDGKVRRHPELPRKTLLRLAATRRLTIVGVWLLDHGCEGAAVWIWRACGMWR